MSDQPIDPLALLEAYNPRWTGVGGSDRASVPLGNGELCSNVWVQRDGIHLYLARSDAISELDRTLKLGEFVVTLDPNPFEEGTVRQELNLRDGSFHVSAEGPFGSVRVVVLIDSESDAAIIRITSRRSLNAQLETRTWRIDNNDATAAAGSIWGDEDRGMASELAAVVESADIFNPRADGVLLYHHNRQSIVPGIANMHNLADLLPALPDLALGRIFGSFTSADQPALIDGNTVRVDGATSVDFRVATFSGQELPVTDLVRDATATLRDAETCQQRTARHWNSYWKRSWIFVSGDVQAERQTTDEVAQAAAANDLPTPVIFTGSAVTRSYLLTKWMTACGSRGAMPILYNGALFTTMPGAGRHLTLDAFGEAFTAEPSSRPTLELNPDERSWTTEHLWQNLRLPYYSLLARGETEPLLTLFAYYRRFWTLNRERAHRQYGALGQWNTEMTLSCGLQSPAIYGLHRDGLEDGYTTNRWGGAINLSPGLELCKLMFDYWRFTGEEGFLTDELVPYAWDLIDFARSCYYRSDPSRLEFGPLNSLETYFDTVNPVAVVAGYRRLVRDLKRLPSTFRGNSIALDEFSDLLPAIPLEADGESIAPATSYEPTRKNVESPELYTLFPFDLREELDEALLQRTWVKCVQVSGALRPATLGEPVGTPSYSGWQYQAPAAVLLGRISVATEALRHNAALRNPGYSFPAMWGPIYDAVPDVDHGANILNTLHLMIREAVTQPEICAQIPGSWSLDFRVFDENGEPVQGRIENGRLELVESE